MSEAKSKNMDVTVDHSSKKKKSGMSKTELKMALVAKRLSMLQDDEVTQPPALSSVNPVHSENTKPSRDIVISDDTLSDEELEIPKSSKNRTKFGSHKRGRVISDDESSEEDTELMLSNTLPKKGSTEQKRIKSNDLSNNKNTKAANTPRMQKITKQKKIKGNDLSNIANSKATDNPRTQGIQRMDLSDPLSMGDESSYMKRAKEVQAKVSPSFIKLMLKSHVSGGFWLGLPKQFCDLHLPIRDSTVVLVDEAGREFSTMYLVAKTGLSGGWRAFSIDHGLLEGDALVFHLIAPTKFKIYIVREQNFDELDGALGLLTLDSGLGQRTSEELSQKLLQTEDYTLVDHPSHSSSEADLGSEVLDGIHFSDSSIKFEGVYSFENFNIIVDGVMIDSKFSYTARKKYYELCCSQNSFLHEHFLKGMNCHLVVGIISETINIADAIRSYKAATTSHEDLKLWEKTLRGFELLGMNVKLLHARVKKLLGEAVESNTAVGSNWLKESIIKRAFAGQRMKALENKLTQLKETMEKIDLEMDTEVTMAR